MKHLIRLTFVLSIASVNAQESNSYSLQQAMDYAVQNSPLVKNAQSDVEIYKKKVKEVTAIGLPQINAEGTFNHFLNIPTTVVPENAFNPFGDPNTLIPLQFGTDYQTSAGVTLSQLIFDGSYLVALKSNKTLIELQNQLAEKTEIDVKNEITKAYYGAVIADENIKTLNQTLETLEKLKAEITAIYKEKINEQQDVEQIELTVETMRNNLSRATMMRNMTYNLLKLHMGLDIKTEITLTDKIENLNTGFNPADYSNREFNASQVTEFKIVQTQVKVTEFSMMREKSAYYPTFGAFITHSYNLPSNDLDLFARRRWYPTSIWGLKLTVPIFSSGMRNYKVQQSKLALEKARTSMQNAENGLKLQAETAKMNFNFANETVTTAKKSLELADRIQQKTLTKYKEGFGSSLDLNQAQTQYLTAQSNYVNSLYNLLNAKAEMDKAFGITQPTTKR